MKYLKYFEKSIKKTDSIAKNHILNDFSKRIENIFKDIKEMDTTGLIKNYWNRSSIIRTYMDDGSISISYSRRIPRLKIVLGLSDDEISMKILCDYPSTEGFSESSLIFSDLIKDSLKDYLVADYIPLLKRSGIVKEPRNSFSLYIKYNL